MSVTNLHDLFHETLKDIYYAEKAILKALPKMAKKATSEDLSAAYTTHAEETEVQIGRLEEIFKMIDKKPQGKRCAAIEGILEEGEEVMNEIEDDNTRDAGMLAAASQAVEHYEISRYGTLMAWAEKLQMDEAVELLQETLDEEEATDLKLSELAESEINDLADQDEDEDTKSGAARSSSSKGNTTGKRSAN